MQIDAIRAPRNAACCNALSTVGEGSWDGSRLLEDDELRHDFARRTGYFVETLADIPATDPVHTVRIDVERLLAAPQISRRITMSGHVYDVDAGLVSTVVEPTSPAAETGL